jgi:predicted DNA-binding transcriptional regulator AlpA
MQTFYPDRQLTQSANLAAALSSALSQFAGALAEAAKGARSGAPLTAANDNEIETPEANWPTDPMTLNEVQSELHLKEAQVVKLRRLWSFPAPRHRGGRYVFSRKEIERWVRLQPDQQNLAAVLRLRPKRFPQSPYPS